MQNDLELFPKEKVMTTKELAEVLGVDISTIKKAVKRMESNGEVIYCLTKDKYNNICFLFTKEQATLIKQEIQKHHNLANNETNGKWYTIQELAEMCGFSSGNALLANPKTNELLSQFNSSNDVKNGGYHNTQKFYSANVLKALKEYQIKNSVSNATKDKDTAISGNVSFIQNQTVKQTISSLLDNPQTLQLLLTESLARQQSLQVENKMMKDIISEAKPKVDYVDAYCDSENLEEIGHLGKVTKIGEIKIFKVLLDGKIIKVRRSTDGVKCYDPCFGYEKYFETVHVPFVRDGRKLSRDKLMLNHKGFMFFRAKYATKEMIAETAGKWLEKELPQK